MCMGSEGVKCRLHATCGRTHPQSPQHRQVLPWHGCCQLSRMMKTCHHCGNSYEKCFDLVVDGGTFSFDSFECAIHSFAPVCGRCGCRVLGHGVKGDGEIFCCAHCARQAGVNGLVDNAEES